MGAVKKITSYVHEFLGRARPRPQLRLKILRHGEVSADALFGEAFRSPLIESESPLQIASAADHAFFLRLCEVYRVLELTQRTLPLMIETYSRFRERRQFEETLTMRYFETEDALLAEFDPNLTAILLAITNHLLEMKTFLRYTDVLPSTAETYVQEALVSLTENWNSLVDKIEARFHWNFKKL